MIENYEHVIVSRSQVWLRETKHVSMSVGSHDDLHYGSTDRYNNATNNSGSIGNFVMATVMGEFITV